MRPVVTDSYLPHSLSLSLGLKKSQHIANSNGALNVSYERSLTGSVALSEGHSNLDDSASGTGTTDDLLNAGESDS
jgi:hypothetical protein